MSSATAYAGGVIRRCAIREHASRRTLPTRCRLLPAEHIYRTELSFRCRFGTGAADEGQQATVPAIIARSRVSRSLQSLLVMARDNWSARNRGLVVIGSSTWEPHRDRAPALRLPATSRARPHDDANHFNRWNVLNRPIDTIDSLATKALVVFVYVALPALRGHRRAVCPPISDIEGVPVRFPLRPVDATPWQYAASTVAGETSLIQHDIFCGDRRQTSNSSSFSTWLS